MNAVAPVSNDLRSVDTWGQNPADAPNPQAILDEADLFGVSVHAESDGRM